jgi:CheY-like chemotaxis protein
MVIPLVCGSHRAGGGLGLAISHQFVEPIGGSIGVESTVGKESIFSSELPVELADETAAGVPQGSVQSREVVGLAPGQPAYRIMIAEDNQDNQQLLSKLMTGIGLDVKVADNGEVCVKLFREWCPHLIWMDRSMPVMDGVKAVHRIRQLPGGEAMKIVAVTPRHGTRSISDNGYITRHGSRPSSSLEKCSRSTAKRERGISSSITKQGIHCMLALRFESVRSANHSRCVNAKTSLT